MWTTPDPILLFQPLTHKQDFYLMNQRSGLIIQLDPMTTNIHHMNWYGSLIQMWSAIEIVF
jgi:hypothetical protein